MKLVRWFKRHLLLCSFLLMLPAFVVTIIVRLSRFGFEKYFPSMEFLLPAVLGMLLLISHILSKFMKKKWILIIMAILVAFYFGSVGYIVVFMGYDGPFFGALSYVIEKPKCEARGCSYVRTWSHSEYYCSCTSDGILPPVPAKPAIYLYPEKKSDITVNVTYLPGFFATYPEYENGWNVTAYPDGKIVNKSDGKEYSYLFWEGNADTYVGYDLSKGFVVKGSDTATFFQKTLSQMGLTPQEYNEFIVYWYPKMKNNAYNLIHFASKDEYADRIPLVVEPKPDSVIRVFMVYKALDEYEDVIPQVINPFERTGFAVIEWGGSFLDD